MAPEDQTVILARALMQIHDFDVLPRDNVIKALLHVKQIANQALIDAELWSPPKSDPPSRTRLRVVK